MMNENTPPTQTDIQSNPIRARKHRKYYNRNLPTPKEIATFIKKRRTEEREKQQPFSINEFMTEMPTIDLTDPLELHGMMEQQANLLNQAFHFIMLTHDSENLDLAFKAQRLMRDTLPIIERYLGYHLYKEPASHPITDYDSPP